MCWCEELSTIRINALLKAVGRKHGREIHVSVFSRPEFEQMLADGNSFAIGITQQPTIALKGDLPHCSTEAATIGS